jgi:hypothetical protein
MSIWMRTMPRARASSSRRATLKREMPSSSAISLFCLLSM